MVVRETRVAEEVREVGEGDEGGGGGQGVCGSRKQLHRWHYALWIHAWPGNDGLNRLPSSPHTPPCKTPSSPHLRAQNLKASSTPALGGRVPSAPAHPHHTPHPHTCALLDLCCSLLLRLLLGCSGPPELYLLPLLRLQDLRGV